jgi:hypothetical protein
MGFLDVTSEGKTCFSCSWVSFWGFTQYLSLELSKTCPSVCTGKTTGAEKSKTFFENQSL